MAKTLTKRRKIGDLGEEIAEMFLVKRGFSPVERNYSRKWGEIDLIMEKKGKLYFVEVKTVSCVMLDLVNSGVTYETPRPEDNLHKWKLDRLGRAIRTYIEERGFSSREWQLDAVMVYLDRDRRKARVETLEDIVIEDRK